jgi:hypothetical protein
MNHANDRSLWVAGVGFGLASLTMLSAVLDWSLIVQTVLVALLIVVPLGVERGVRPTRRRR